MQQAYLPRSSSFGRFQMVLMSPLLVVALSLTLTRQQGNANSFQSRVLMPAAQSPAWVPTIAQSSIPVTITRQGGQVKVNGRTLSIPWSQRQDSLGVADAGLISAIGVDLLDTNDGNQQPIAWYSDQRSTPLILSSWLTQQYRYLDIGTLAQQFGWQTEIQGTTLQITTPAAQVITLRQGSQTWGDRIVVDLDRATPWQVDEQRGETIVTLDAQIAPALISGFRGRAGKQIKTLSVEANGNRTRLRISHSNTLRPRVWSLNHPDRLLIDLRSDAMVERTIQWAPGITWQQRWVTIGSGQFPVIGLEIDPTQPGVSLKPILSSPSGNIGTAPLFSTAQRSQVAAAINAGFFNRNNQLPLGAIRNNSRWISGPILNRGAIGWNETGDLKVGHLNLQETLTTATGQKIVLQSTNSGFVGAGVARYTPDWGRQYTPIIDAETLITVRNNQIIDRKLVAKAGQIKLDIPTDGYLLVVRADQDQLNLLLPGSQVQIEATLQPEAFDQYAQILGAGPLLIQDRRMVLNPESERFSTNFIQEAAVRSVIASTTEGTLLLLTVNNRAGGSGPTLAELAQIMQRLGVVNALNLDGGSSTTLYLGGQILNRASSSAARVHNGIGVYIQP
jgi:hypothetical protein